jgi:hypothetical protein
MGANPNSASMSQESVKDVAPSKKIKDTLGKKAAK